MRPWFPWQLDSLWRFGAGVFLVLGATAIGNLLMGMTSLWRIAFLGVVTVVLAPLVEELVFRGVMFPALVQLKGRTVGLWGTSILFGLIHFNLFSLLPLIVMGLLLALLYERTRNLLAPIAVHAAFNLINFVLVLSGVGQ